MKYALALAALLCSALLLTQGPSNAVTTSPAFPGHLPGRTLVGLHGSDILTGPVKVDRLYFQWDDQDTEDALIRKTIAEGKIPWVSFKPPAGGIPAVLDGSQDVALAQRGLRYASYGAPVLATFFHEPVGDVQPEEFWAGFNYVKHEMGFGVRGLRNKTTFTPILNGYVYADWYDTKATNPKGGLEEWVAPGVNLRTFGFDNYGTTTELSRMFTDLRARGVSTVSLGEFGRDQGSTSFSGKMALFGRQRGFLAVNCYFNSRIQEFGNNTSPLGPGLIELSMFKNYRDNS